MPTELTDDLRSEVEMALCMMIGRMKDQGASVDETVRILDGLQHFRFDDNHKAVETFRRIWE